MACAKKEEEPTKLLREILLELRRLNANLEKRSVAAPLPLQGMHELDDNDSEELEQFE